MSMKRIAGHKNQNKHIIMFSYYLNRQMLRGGRFQNNKTSSVKALAETDITDNVIDS